MKRVRKKADGKNTKSHMSTNEETPRKVTSRLTKTKQANTTLQPKAISGYT